MKNESRFLALPYVGWLALFVIAPIIIVVIYAFSSADGGFTLLNFANMNKYAGVFGRSLWLAFLATFFCILIGYPLAYCLSRLKARVQSIFVMLTMLPMWMNILLRTYAWMSILENTGILNKALTFFGFPTVSIINTQGAIILGMVYNFIPFMVLPVYSVISKIDGSLIEAAQDLGANTMEVFTQVIFPLSLPGVLSGITMVFVPAVSTFVISQLLGGGKYLMLGDLIETAFLGSTYNPYLGSAISLVMMVIVMICIWLMNKFGSGDDEAVLL